MKGLTVQICKETIEQIKELKRVEVGPLAERPEGLVDLLNQQNGFYTVYC